MRPKKYYKTIAVIVALALNATGLASVGETIGNYLDTESSSGNALLATSLDMTLATTSWNTAPQELDMGRGSSTSRTVTIGSAGDISFDYTFVYREDTEASNPALCSALILIAEKNGATQYEGPLASFTLATSSIHDAEDSWDFTITIPEDAPDSLEDSSCLWSFAAISSQPGFAAGEAYHDEEEFENLIETGSWNSPAHSRESIGAIEDARVDEEHPGTNYGNSGTLEVESQEGKNQRSFLKFAIPLPPSTLISDATLNIFMTDAPGLSRVYDLAPVASGWSEGSVDWATQPGALLTATNSAMTGTANNMWMQFSVWADASAFVSGSLANNGWRLSDREENSSSSPRTSFASSEYDAHPELRPYLDVTFTPPSVTTDHLVINEVYYAVAPGRGSDTNNEWIELYNPTEVPVDITGWQICDNVELGCDTISASTIIPAHGFAIVANDASTWTLQWPEIASSSAVTVAVGSKLGSNGLRDAGDRVIVRDPASVIVDAMSYGDDLTYFSLPGDRQGDSLARVVKGYDTDTASDFIINAAPNPGTNPSASGREVMRVTADGVLVADAQEGFPDTSMAVLTLFVEENAENDIVKTEDSALVPQVSIPEPLMVETATSTTTSSEESIVIIPGPPTGEEGTASSTEPLDLPTETATTTEIRDETEVETEVSGGDEEQEPPVVAEEEPVVEEAPEPPVAEEAPAIVPEKQEAPSSNE